jgi:hypothetical protein
MAMTTQRQSQDEINGLYEAEYQRRAERVQSGGNWLLAIGLTAMFALLAVMCADRMTLFGEHYPGERKAYALERYGILAHTEAENKDNK